VISILIAPDSFKHSLSSYGVCRAIQKGLLRFDPSIRTILQPMADGGEGSLEVIKNSTHSRVITLQVSDPLFRPIDAYYLLEGKNAYIEMAQASGLELLSVEERNCLLTTTYGFGELILDGIRRGATRIYLFVGGSATNDAGIGMATALGYKFLDGFLKPLKPIGESLNKIKHISSSELKFDRQKIEFTMACDVQNPLYGPDGAAFTYASQKGADARALQLLDDGLQSIAEIFLTELNKDTAFLPGGGAAGGMGAGAVALLNAQLSPGFRTIMEIIKLEQKMDDIDLIITGEGSLDQQTLKGKLVHGICELAKIRNIPVIAICGKNQLSKDQFTKLGLQKVVAIKSDDISIEKAINEAGIRLESLAYDTIKTYLSK
jgi:glycerate kinase